MTGSLASTIGAYNPFRYKGYYYDAETEMYYCQSRYYVPSWGRWLNSDHPHYLNPSEFMGMNLYAYCGNNPVMYTDPSGTVFLLGLILGAIIGAGIGFGIATYIDYKDDGEVFNGSVKWYEYLALTAGGAFIGGTVGAFLPEIGGAISAFAKTTFTIGNIISGAGTMAAVTVTGAQILVGAGVVAGAVLGLILFASTNRPKNNRVQNKQLRDAVRSIGYDPNQPHIKDIINKIEISIRRKQKDLGWKELIEYIKRFF